MARISDCQKILRYLETHEWISNAVAVHQLGCYRFSGRIYDLKKAGNEFDDRMVYGTDEDGNPTHWKEFKLIKKVS